MHNNTSVDYLLHTDTHAIAECRREKSKKNRQAECPRSGDKVTRIGLV